MPHMIITAILMLVGLHEAEKQLERLPNEFPRDIPTQECFRICYVKLVSNTMLIGTLIAALSILTSHTAAADLAITEDLLFLLGAGLGMRLANQSVSTIRVFVRMKSSGRGNGLTISDYLPSLIIMPLLPACIAAFS